MVVITWSTNSKERNFKKKYFKTYNLCSGDSLTSDKNRLTLFKIKGELGKDDYYRMGRNLTYTCDG